MPVKPISSYPFLDIARQHGIRYELVLAMGDMYIHSRVPAPSIVASEFEESALHTLTPKILQASTNFIDIVREGWDQS